MADRFVRKWTQILKRAQLEHAEQPVTPSRYFKWIGLPVKDPYGTPIGHVLSIDPDGTGEAWLTIAASWGVLDWLGALGAGDHPTFKVHSSDVEDSPDRLRLKSEVFTKH
jgi:hypothetical protein